jgi:hypothetical protein
MEEHQFKRLYLLVQALTWRLAAAEEIVLLVEVVAALTQVLPLLQVKLIQAGEAGAGHITVLVLL